jgi:hypothetical protein
MSTAYVDSDKLRDFANRLKQFATELEDYSNSLVVEMNRLSETWRDEQFYIFEADFVHASAFIHRLLEEIREVTPKLERDAERIDRFHGK